MSADTEALLATVRESLISMENMPEALHAFDSLAAEISRLRSERDDYRDTSAAKQHAIEELKRQLGSVEKFLASPPGPDYYPAGIHWMRDREIEGEGR